MREPVIKVRWKTSGFILWLAGLGIGLAAGLAAGWMAGHGRDGGTGASESLTTHSGPTIEQVQALASLVTLKVDVADVQETHLEGYTGGEKVALLIKGDFLLGTDLAQARFEEVDSVAHTAVLALPEPAIASPRLDHGRTRIFAISDSGLWQIAPGGSQASTALVNRAYVEAQRFIARVCDDPTLLGRSRQQAEQVLTGFFQATGWRITLRWVE